MTLSLSTVDGRVDNAFHDHAPRHAANLKRDCDSPHLKCNATAEHSLHSERERSHDLEHKPLGGDTRMDDPNGNTSKSWRAFVKTSKHVQMAACTSLSSHSHLGQLGVDWIIWNLIMDDLW
jgi:hypothetical protein